MKTKTSYLLFVILILASAIGVCLVAARILYTGRFAHIYLVWNLFLAWIPLGLSLLAWRYRESRRPLLVCAFFWLLFFPNAPYIVTDLVHLKARPPVPFWFDLMLLQLFVWLGVFIGFLSLHRMHELVSHRFDWRVGWVFVLVVVGLTGFGIYLGRFERWNSWDLFLSPLGLLGDIADVIRHPRANKTAIVFPALFGTFFLLAYVMLYALTHWRSAQPASAPLRSEAMENARCL
jgi:uncharacterized membrane protein